MAGTWWRRRRLCALVVVALAAAATAAIAGADLELERTLKSLGAAACPNCLPPPPPPPAPRPRADALRLEAVKRQILSKLGMRHKPNVTAALPRDLVLETLFRAEDGAPARPQPPPAADDDADAAAAALDDFYGRTSEIIAFAEQGHRVNGNRLLEFRVSADAAHGGAQELRVRSATLWLKADMRHARAAHCRSTDIYVFKFTAALSHSVHINSQEFNELTVDPVALSLDESRPGWQKVDVSGTVRDWLEAGGGSGGRLHLLVDCSGCCGNWHVRLLNEAAAVAAAAAGVEEARHRPFLVVRTDPMATRRVRRRALDCDAGAGNQCCKQRFYVSFKELGWDDWIIAPHGYYANYCRGDCGHARTPDAFATYHAHVLEEVRKTHHLSGMQACCAPLKFASMSLIYYGPEANIVKRDLPKMVVDECGCP